MGKPIVPFIATPLHTSFGQHYMSAHSLWRGATTRQLQVVSSPSINSVLPANFNDLLCAALNRREDLGITHFAMLHGDIVPQIGWFDILYDEMCATKADIISAIVPIKNADGWTSTAIGNRQPDGFPRNFKLTMRDVFELPETFSIEDTPWADSGDYLLLNTGCMLFSVDAPWVEEFCKDGGFGFETWIVKQDGKYKSVAFSEDWRMSLWAGQRGLKCVATRKVELKHYGVIAYGNDEPWGVAPMNERLKPQTVAT